MTPAARVQAAIELLDQILIAARQAGSAADTIVARYFKDRRYAGSGDRRAVRELVYRAIRTWGDPPYSGRAAMLGLAQGEPDLMRLFDGVAHGPAPVTAGESRAEGGAIPAWLSGRLDPLLDEAEIADLLTRAPLDLRVNRLKGDVEGALAAFPGAARTALSPIGLRLSESLAVEQSEAWRSGQIEVQDEGSQLVALACAAKPDMIVIDLCAGAGGKTLALAAGMAGRGRIIACDTDRGRLSRLAPRLMRAGAAAVETRLLDPGGELQALGDLANGADIVLVDAPCSGSGTWRRNPETRWRLTPDRLARLVDTQARLLDIAAQLTAPDGHFVYAVCSVLAEEGRGQAKALGARHSRLVRQDVPIPGGRAAGPGRLLTPAHDGTDGFFVARWRASC